MTQKELLYVEDAIGHEDNLIKICNESLNYLDDDFKSVFESEVEYHKNLRKNLVNLLEDELNE